jgi:hypothetical protein
MLSTEDRARLILEWKRQPIQFVQDVIGVKKPEDWQADALIALETESRLAIRSGHGVGKTSLDSWVTLWWLLTRLDAKVGITAPAAPQIDAALWPEIRKWWAAIRGGLFAEIFDAEFLRITSDSILCRNGNLAVARTARPDQPEALQGIHAEHVLFLVDEASGVADPVWESALGSLSTPGAKAILTGNPTRTSGFFHAAFHSARNFWWTRKVSSEEVSDERVDRAFIKELEAKYGRDSNVFRVRVMGEFPQSEDDVCIPLHLLESAVNRFDKIDQSGPIIVWGLDVARFGSDRTVLVKRWGNKVIEKPITWAGLDTMQVSGKIIKEWNESEYRPDAICVDVIGIGAGVVDRLNEIGLPVVPVNVAESPSVEPDRFMRLRDELWFAARDWFEGRSCAIPDDDELIAELSGVKYKITSTGKLQIESKDEMKKRGMRSPDKADAFCLTLAVPDLSRSRVSYVPETYAEG